jgi:dihydroorotate dehydrogenase (NAD+) catalytic subunit
MGTDLSTEICGIKLKNPIIVTPGPLTRDGEAVQRAAKNGAAAAIIRSIAMEGGRDPEPCFAPLNGGILNATTFSDLGLDEWMKKEFSKAKKAGIPVIGSIFVPRGKATASEYLELAEKVGEAGVDMLHIVTNYVVLSYDEARKIIKAVKRACDLPICVNLNYTDNIDLVGEKMKKAGADAALAVDAPWAMKINVETGMPTLGSPDGTGHLSGRPMHPLAVYSVYKLAKKVDLPLIGSTGVSSGEDAIEIMMAGASAVGLQSTLILEGDEKILRIIDEMKEILKKQKVKSVKEIIGKTVKLMKSQTEKDMKYHRNGSCSLEEMRKILRNSPGIGK